MRSKSTFLIFTNVMILFVIFALLTQALVIIPRIAVTENLSGLVEVQRSGHGYWVPLAKGSPIKTGDIVRTDDTGQAEFKWADGTRWKILPNTRLLVKKAVHNMLKRGDDSQLELDNGKVFVRIIKALTEASRFEVETPTAVAAVRGTIFSVEYDKEGTKVAVYKGHVKVSSGSADAKMIEPGQSAISPQSGSVNTTTSTEADAAFAQQPSIINPALDGITVKSLAPDRAKITGFTEAGDKLIVNDTKVRTRGDGFFEKHLALQPGINTVTIVTTDKHGEQTKVVKTIQGPAIPPPPASPVSASATNAPSN